MYAIVATALFVDVDPGQKKPWDLMQEGRQKSKQHKKGEIIIPVLLHFIVSLRNMLKGE